MPEKKYHWGVGNRLASAAGSTTTSSPYRMSQPVGQGQPQQGRLQEVMGGIPMATMAVTGLCVALHLMVLLTGLDINTMAINAGKVLYSLEFYRLVTAAYFHVGILHILMNMLSFVSIGSWLENKCGTLYMMMTIMWSTLLGNLIYVTVCWLLALYITGDYGWLGYTSVGFSGVIFTLAFIESHSSAEATHSVFGFFQVPSKLYPWVLLLLLQLMMPSISFLGHLSGLLVGVLQCYGVLNWLLPSAAFIRTLEGCGPLAMVARSSKFIPCPDYLDLNSSGQGSILTYFYQLVMYIGQGICYVSQAIGMFCRSLCGGSGGAASLPTHHSSGIPPHVRLASDPVMDRQHAQDVRRYEAPDSPQRSRLVL